MVKSGKEFGLAVIGCGTIGRIRAEFARDYPGVGWLGLCDLKEDLGRKLAEDTGADLFTTDFNELLARPEVTAAIIATGRPNAGGGRTRPRSVYRETTGDRRTSFREGVRRY